MKRNKSRAPSKPQPLLRFCGTTDLIFFLRYFYSAANWKNGRSRYAPAASGSLEKKFVFIYFFLFLIGGHWTGSFHGRRDKAVVFVFGIALLFFPFKGNLCVISEGTVTCWPHSAVALVSMYLLWVVVASRPAFLDKLLPGVSGTLTSQRRSYRLGRVRFRFSRFWPVSLFYGRKEPSSPPVMGPG